MPPLMGEPGQHILTLTDRELLYRLGWFTRMRWVMGTMALLILLFSWFVLGVRFRTESGAATMTPAVQVVLVIFLYNAIFTFLTHITYAKGLMSRGLIDQLALAQLVCDTVATVVLVHSTGGVENFFIVIVLLPLVIATELLPQRLAYATAGGAAVLVNAAAWGEQQELLDHVHAEWPGGGVNLYADPYYVLEVTVAMTVMIFLTVFMASSISKRLRAREAELERAHRECALADEAKSFFMRKAGHEMRAPLAAIHSTLEAIGERGESVPPDLRRLLSRAKNRMEGLMELMDDLRNYSRLRSPEGMLRLETLQMDGLVRDTAELFRRQADRAGVRMRCRAQPLRIEGDRELLREIVTNLVSNAIQYTPEGGEVDIELTQQDTQAVLCVSDTGIGLDEDARENLFKEFYRSAHARQRWPEGTGLGLAITRRVTEMHRGQISFADRPGGGTTFTVRLPLSQPGSQA